MIATKISTASLDEVLPFEVRHGQDTMKTTGDIVRLYNKLIEKYPTYTGLIFAKIDDTGVGGGVTDRLREVKKELELTRLMVVPVNFASSVKHSKDYADISTLMWGYVRDMMESEELKLPEDSELVAQFSIRKYTVTSRGKLQLESKQDMKKRQIKSPDRADAVVMACIPVQYNDKSIRKGGARA